jgi:hypothetical protein
LGALLHDRQRDGFLHSLGQQQPVISLAADRLETAYSVEKLIAEAAIVVAIFST